MSRYQIGIDIISLPLFPHSNRSYYRNELILNKGFQYCTVNGYYFTYHADINYFRWLIRAHVLLIFHFFGSDELTVLT